MKQYPEGWLDRWLVGEAPDGSFRTVKVKAKHIPAEGVWVCDTRHPDCDTFALETVDALKVYDSEVEAAERVRQLSAGSPN